MKLFSGAVSLSALLALGLSAPAFSQTPCAVFTYVKTSTVDPNWPDSLTNGFGYHQYMTQPLSAQAAKGCVQLPPGFSANIWATEDPAMSGTRALVAMNWDEKGRLWGIETSDYPNRVLTTPTPGGGGRDRIVILEDTNGDGVADTRKVFATGFNLLTGLVHTVDGLVVAGAPNIYLFKDANNDDVADNPSGTILYRGFGRGDTHATISNLMYGLDNWIYGTIGYSGGSNINNPTTAQTFTGSWSQVIFRMKSDGSSIQSVTAMSNNTWGLGISETGQIFASTANRDHSLHQVYPGQRAQTPIYSGADQSYVREASGVWAHPHPVTKHFNINNAGYPATANHSLYTARQFPQRYWDRIAFTCDAPHHLCHEVVLAPYKSTWRGAEDTTRPNIFASADPWSAPIQAHVGPDGSLWVLDWYDYLLNHNGVCGKIACGTGAAQVSPVRDTSKTRVYRVVYDARPVDAILNLTSATEDQLIQTFYHTNFLWRLQAQRLLLKRGKNSGLTTKLSAMLNLKTVNDMGESPHVIHALRTLQGFGLFDSLPATWVPVLSDLLRHPSAGVRWNALDAMPNNALSTTAILNQGRINDPSALVRIMALYKLTQLPGTKAGDMYTPYVTLDTYSQSRFTAVGGLTSTASMPSTPALYDPVAIAPGSGRLPLASDATIVYRNGGLQILGLKSSVSGQLTLWNLKGERVARVAVSGGKPAGRTVLVEGIYTFSLDLDGGQTQTGRFSIFH